jgi:predicted metal-dependent phosphoesterase TrpH/glycosyltransferase involved in cell wall biosynthesis
MTARYSIAHVTPYPWEAEHEVNVYVQRVTAELTRRGHRVLIAAPSRSHELIGQSRQALRAARQDPEALLGRAAIDEPLLVAVGEVLDVPSSTRRRPPAVPIDVSRTLEQLLMTLPLDFVHVHEPFAPSTASLALRHSRSLNVGSFHAPTERVVATQVARRVVELFFGRLDARVASFEATRALMARYFPAEYRVVLPGAAPVGRRQNDSPIASNADAVRLLFVEHEERSALRLFLRALRRLRASAPWLATVVSARGESSTTPLRAALRGQVSFLKPEEADVGQLLAGADVVVCASDGAVPAPGLLLDALAAGVVPVTSRLPVYEEVLGEGERGLLFEIGDTDTLAAQLGRLIDDHALSRRLSAAAQPLREHLSWERTGEELEQVYRAVAARRHDGLARQDIRRRLSSRPLIDVDLHMHTDHSSDCATPVEVLLATARSQRLGAIAVTDHNEISGALEARAKADGVKVIVGEEVKTASQGEVIGLFIEEKIPRGLSLAETVAEIKRQGGLVYVPHPFDRLHSVPDYEHLLTILEKVDAIEVFNPRVAIGAFNEEAARFAAKYRLVAGAGSDSHVAQGLGSVRIRMRDFEGPDEFLESLREADIITRPTSLLYVQALKFLETKATPAPARRARRERRVRRASRS